MNPCASVLIVPRCCGKSCLSFNHRTTSVLGEVIKDHYSYQDQLIVSWKHVFVELQVILHFSKTRKPSVHEPNIYLGATRTWILHDYPSMKVRFGVINYAALVDVKATCCRPFALLFAWKNIVIVIS